MKLFLVLLAPLVVSGLSLKVFDSTEHCFDVTGNSTQYLHFSYVASGRNEENVNLRVTITRL